MTQEEILKYAIDNGVINLQEISQKANIELMEKVDEVHKYKITKLNGKNDQRWQTYVLDSRKKNGRRIFKAAEKNKLYNKLAEYYNIIDTVESSKSMEEVFKKWIPYKRTITNSENTIQRHINHWKRYFEGTEIVKKSMTNIDVILLESWANSLIKDHNLTRKEWQNLKTIINGIWTYAFRTGVVKINPWESVKITVRFRQVNKKTPEEEVFIGDELDKIIVKCNEYYELTKNEVYLAIIFNFYCGLRVGELCGLKFKDVNYEKNYISVEREVTQRIILDVNGRRKYKWIIENHTKTYTNRFVPLIPKAKNVLTKIISKRNGDCDKEEFLFMRKDTYLNKEQVNQSLWRVCECSGLGKKSSHKIRKTFASKLNANGVPIDEIRTLLGHSDAQTTLGYIYNPLPKEKTLEMIRDAFDNN
ncbi:site-specific integrase [Clostridium sp. HBUAS56010]|uniref:tyrosine-type recombinase/integrase n=1 Tax=Clostridium sp. HBUAS56010 TaxID=2571127 RepID=UPI00117758B2|nr:site-specific integrase [Clostridium sp. HBUAS56010]